MLEKWIALSIRPASPEDNVTCGKNGQQTTWRQWHLQFIRSATASRQIICIRGGFFFFKPRARAGSEASCGGCHHPAWKENGPPPMGKYDFLPFHTIRRRLIFLGFFFFFFFPSWWGGGGGLVFLVAPCCSQGETLHATLRYHLSLWLSVYLSEQDW